MTIPTTLISATELKRLLVDLKEKRPDICVRFRLIGEMWQEKFMRIMLVTERGVVLSDDGERLVSVPNLNDVIQFETDNGFQNYQPHYHYDVQPSGELG